MGVPVIETPRDFRRYVTSVHHRRGFRMPNAFAIGAVRFGEDGSLQDVIFPKINTGDNFGSATAFADVTHHRSGNAVRPLDFWELKELEELLRPFLDDPESHPNTAAFLEVSRLALSPHNMKPVVVFVGDIDTSFIDVDLAHDAVQGDTALRPVYDRFLELIADQQTVMA